MKSPDTVENHISTLPPSIGPLLSKVLVLDLEIHPEEDRLLKIGAIKVAPRREMGFKGSFDPAASLDRVAEWGKSADYLLGHNMAEHDLPWISGHFPGHPLTTLPVIDTLFLSPLAFPTNPYHRLVKNYKLIKESVNDPVGDCKQTLILFKDELFAFAEMAPELRGLYGAVLSRSFPGHGYGRLFGQLFGSSLPDKDACYRIWMDQIRDRACVHQARDIFARKWDEPSETVTLAYMLAWLRVAGGNSLVPAWVWHRYPSIPSMLSRLRQTPCGKKDCSYCRDRFDIRQQLQTYFGFDDFLPVADERPPLQEQVVTGLVEGKDVLAVLPTGAGKSLCYLLPALMQSAQRNTLTLIISPLQSLMKDQVDGLVRKGILKGCTINSSMTMLERTRTLDGIRLGDLDLLWIAPEQFRNTTVKDILKQREIGMIVMDEAHCFSKWGHDFRPDYLALSSFIREIWPGEPYPRPLIGCFTATAKPDVIGEIREYFRTEMDRELAVFEGGHERTNLKFRVIPCPEQEKIGRIHAILQDVFVGEQQGGAIVFVPTRKKAEQYADSLADMDWLCDYYHAGRTPEDKRSVQEKFLCGDLQVMVATNAFGMGVDKPDVRVVIHAAVPGSLENYLQEAGRAGRDRNPALCCLLYDREDLETQFERCCATQLSHRDIRSLFAGLKRIANTRPENTVVMTSGELLGSRELEEVTFDNLDAQETLADTKVRTALSWLERTDKLIRGDNHTQVVQGTVLVPNKEEALATINRLNLSASSRDLWIRLVDILLQADPKSLINTDSLAMELGEDPNKLLSILHAMRKAGIIDHDLNMTCFVRKGIADDSLKRFAGYVGLEEAVLRVMEEDEPDAVKHTRYTFPMRSISQRIRDGGEEGANPQAILGVLELLIQEKMIRLSHLNHGSYGVILRKTWEEIRTHVRERVSVARVVLQFLLDKIPSATRGKDLLVSFKSGDLEKALRRDMTTMTLPDGFERSQIALLALHHMKALCLQNGLAVIRPAMTLTVKEPKASFTVRDFFSLALFYKEKIAQVHIMGKYAEMGTLRDGIKLALILVRDYFGKEREAFISTYFNGHEATLELPVSEEKHEAIVSGLDPVQKKAVETRDGKNLLVVAGPGSGKTRIIVHRIGWLVKVKRVRPDRILALAFNRNAVAELRRRLIALLGKSGRRVRVQTYHGLALSITGRSLMGTQASENVFAGIIEEAVAYLESSRQEGQDMVGDWRDKVLGLEHILVDEYQDINESEYALLSLLAGRNEEEQGKRPTLMAVGDADQNIYAFQGSNVRFIRMFEKDYNAARVYMKRNYRSLAPIIRAADSLIAHNHDRMDSPPGEPVRGEGGEPVRVVSVSSHEAIFKAVLLRAGELMEEKGYAPEDICILCRTNQEVFTLMRLARNMGQTLQVIRRRELPFTQIREVREILELLVGCGRTICSGHEVRELVETLVRESDVLPRYRLWLSYLEAMAVDYEQEYGKLKQPVQVFVDMVFELARDLGRFGQKKAQGFRVTTMHSAKGMEFPVVLLMGHPIADASLEEERRLYYVAMTRAKDRLECFHGPDPHCFIREILETGAESVITRDMSLSLNGAEARLCTGILWEMKPDDLVLSFPAYTNGHPQTVSTIDGLGRREEACTYACEPCGQRFRITANGVPVALLSNKGSERLSGYLARGYRMEKMVFQAQLRRTPSEYDLANDQVDAKQYPYWHVPLFQMILSKSGGPT